MKIFIVTFLLFLFALTLPAPAKADDQTDGIIIGVLATKIFQEIRNDMRRDKQVIYVPDTEEYPPFHCTGDSVKCAYERGAYEREKEAYEKAKQRAYECGRWGRNCESN